MSYINVPSAGLGSLEDYIKGVVDSPVTFTEFHPDSGLWIPIHNFQAGGILINFTAPDYSLELDSPGPNPSAMVQSQRMNGVASRFRIHPDSSGKIVLRVRVENLTYENFPVNNGNLWAVGAWLRGVNYTPASAGGHGFGMIGQTTFSLSACYAGEFRFASAPGSLSCGAIRLSASPQTSPVVPCDIRKHIEFSSKYAAGSYQVNEVDSDADFNDSGTPTSFTNAATHFLAGYEVLAGFSVILGFFANCVHDLSCKITEFEVEKGIISWQGGGF